MTPAGADTDDRKRERLIGDVVAGVSVALVLIPQSLAYAEIAGVPAYVGLSAAALPLLVAAYFVSSPYLQTGPVALTSLLTFGALAGFEEQDASRYIKLAALLAIMAGAIRLILGLLRLGSVAYIMTKPVVLGFTTGAAVLIVFSQLPKVFGLDTDAGVVRGALDAVTTPDLWERSAIVISIITIAITAGGRRLHPLFPGVLVALSAILIWSNVTGYSGLVVGELPGGFPTPSLDLPWDQSARLIIPALVIAIVGFAEPASIARTYAEIENTPWDASKELVSQGIANLTSGLVGAFPVGGSFSRSSLGHMAGAKTKLSGAITGAIVLVLLPIAPALENLPRAVLGAIVIYSVVKLIRFVHIFRMRTDSLPDASVATFTCVVTVVSSPNLEIGVILGILASGLAYLYDRSRAPARS